MRLRPDRRLRSCGGLPVRPLPAVLLAVGGAALAGAAPTAAQAVAADPLMHDVRVLAADSMEGRAAGSEGGRRARDYLLARLAGLGFAPVADTFEVRRRQGPVEGVNLRVSIPGTVHPDRHVVLTAHYDHVGVREGEIYNGADDNASGAAALLALAEWFAAHPPRHTVQVVLLDAEEGGLQGARRFVAEPPVPLDAVLLNVNLDMVARSSSELWVAGTHPWPALLPLVEAVEAAPPVVLLRGHDTPEDQGADNWVMASDHGVFHEQGIPFLYFGVADHPDYHRPTDDADRIDPAFLEAAVETIRRVVVEADARLDGRRPGA